MPSTNRLGRLKIFLGYAPGVGKTYQMLDEAQNLRRQGHDIVIGYFEPHGRKDTIAKTDGLETVPRRALEYRGTSFEEMDTDAIRRRRPEICIVDEFPHTNIPGSERLKRWEDVLVLLDDGIDVVTTMNVQHIDSLNDQIFSISGVRVRETIPDWIVREADEVVMVDLTPRALLNRLERGVVYAPEKARQALLNFFKESTLVALREFALRQTAHELEARHGDTGPGQSAEASPERVLIVVTADDSSPGVIRRGRRVADHLQAECYAVAVENSDRRDATEKNLTLARNLHIETRWLQGKDAAQAIVEFARMRNVTQIFVGRQPSERRRVFGGTLVQRIVHLAEDMQVTLVADRRFGGRG